ncbi:other 1 protein kinase [Moniliophthora roreri MCA 2997]|uniref:Other 1 protein kinase n=1 Tax=Moniliophthora roreri (strain MCA 2997) TaxID=1381753 RepID=V2WSY4_MONRO|nr:other 1 protein kinase [Moniliophthora roreri MCA 2997]
MEFKWKEGDDGFDDSDKGPFEKATQQATDTRGQLSTYAGALLISQFRTHAFSVQITRDYARLIRWDRAGAIVTRKFCYYEEPFLVDFLWRYNYASAEARGHDPTVTELKDRSHAKKVRAALGMEESQRVWKFVLIDENGEEHHFFGGKVAFKGVGVPASRATRGFLVVDSQGNRRYLKDTWRILSDTIQKEGDVYALLKEHNVPHVPDVIVSGNAVGDWQRTKTHEYVTPTFQDAVLRNHQHYFIVFAQVGTPLKDFKNSFELVQATSHAIEGICFSCKDLWRRC